jgi:hypothetical protein
MHAGVGATISRTTPGSGSAASQSKSQVDCWASLVMSISTGPGRPERAMRKASRTVAATSSARVTR